MLKISGGGVIALLLFALLFSSCNDFLSAVDAKKQIEDAIAYANAPSYLIKVVNKKNHGNIVKPAAGETSKKVTDVFEIRFEAYTDYEFLKWEVSSPNLPQGESIYDYISLENEKVAETNVTLLKALEGIVITPVTAERAHIISYSPMTNGVIKNSTIVVLFDHDMSEDSIYYSKEEIDELKKEYSLKDQDFLPEGAVIGQTKIYGYKKDGEIFYKNISLVNNKSGKNIAHLFDAPFFEGSRTLSITTKDKINGIDDFTQVLVTIEKGMFYEQGDKHIEMGGIKRWMYQVSTRPDNTPLGFQVNNGKKCFDFKLDQTEISNADTQPAVQNLYYPIVTNKKITLSLDVMLQELSGGTGPTSNFYLCYERVKESNYTTNGNGSDKTGNFSFDYDNYTSEEALFNNNIEIELPKDGVYRIWFDFPDRSNNHFYWPEGAVPDVSAAETSTKGFYISKDETKISKPSSVTISSSNSTTYKLEWTEPGAADYKEAIVSMGQNDLDPFTRGTKTANLTNITSGNNYTVKVVFKDYAGNESEAYVVPKFLTGAVCTGTSASKVFAKDKKYSDYGLSLALSYSDGSSKNDSSKTISSVIRTSDGPITYKEGNITKQVGGLENGYYVGASDILTETPVKMPDSYTGTGTASSEKYYKFGDFPQTLAANQSSSNYGTSPVYNDWYLGKDGYFYAKKNNKYYKVEPIVWRALNQSDLTKRYGGRIVLLSEKVLFEHQWYSGNNPSDSYYNSDIRTYLNGNFFSTAFNQIAKNKIPKVSVDNSRTSHLLYEHERLSNAGNGSQTTTDNVFLLSVWDVTIKADNWFDDPDDSTPARKRFGTKYACDDETQVREWWLRSLTNNGQVVYIKTDGTLANGDDIDDNFYCASQSSTKGIVPAICVAGTDLPQ